MNSYPFGERLRSLREARSLSQRELGELIGLNAGAISHYEVGRRGVSISHAAKLAKALGVTLGELVPVDEHGNFVEPVAQSQLTQPVTQA